MTGERGVGLLAIVTILGASACASNDRPVVPVEIANPTLLAGDLPAVSISKPSPGAKDAFERCHIGDIVPVEQVTGMGQVPSTSDVLHYVPLTGRERQLNEGGPAWVIQIEGEVQQRGSEIWVDPTCIVTAGDVGYYATGPVKNTSTGEVLAPEPPSTPPDRALPPLVP